MGARKFTVKELSTTRVYRGEITAADLRKRFNLPADAVLLVGNNADDETVNLDDNDIQVSWESVTKGDV